jgi:hypothetical protein
VAHLGQSPEGSVTPDMDSNEAKDLSYKTLVDNRLTALISIDPSDDNL